MNFRVFFFVGLFSSILYASPCFAGLFDKFSRDETYEDCILRNMKGVTSDVAANLIKKACYKKNEEQKKTRLVKLSKEQVALITGKASVDSLKLFIINVENGNKDYELAEVVVLIMDKDSGESHELIGEISPSSAWISPLSSGDVTIFPETIPKNWDWFILGAKGFKVN